MSPHIEQIANLIRTQGWRADAGRGPVLSGFIDKFVCFAHAHREHGGAWLIALPVLAVRISPSFALWAWGAWGIPVALLGWLGMGVVDYAGKAQTRRVDALEADRGHPGGAA